jgi:riboflavin kinase / FMN adenylyltransferase
MLQRFLAKVIQGSGRGKRIGSPTINMDLNDVPADMEEGIYACWANIDGTWQAGALHYGPRPVFKDISSCEVYLLDTTVNDVPSTIEIALVAYLRPVLDFPSVEALTRQITEDVTQTRAMLATHDSPQS